MYKCFYFVISSSSKGNYGNKVFQRRVSQGILQVFDRIVAWEKECFLKSIFSGFVLGESGFNEFSWGWIPLESFCG